MPILPSDIKLLASERMTDATDGGGRMTINEIPDGVSGSVFPKVSRFDTVYGRVNLRKIYAAVRTALSETYGGAHTIITDPPNNSRIGIVMFSTGSHFDDRTAAQNRVESYVVAGPLSRMRMYGTQVINQRALLVYQREEDPLPDVGEVLCLSIEAQGYTPVQQFVRIDEVSHELRTFTDQSGDFVRRVISLKLTTPLTQTFMGAEPSRYSSDAAVTKVRDTQVADSARYYGIQPLVEPASIGALSIKLASIYAPLVPSTTRETAVSMAEVAGAAEMVQSGDPISMPWYGATWSAGQTATRYLPTGVLPGSFIFAGDIQDDGKGKVTGQYGTTGTIDYAAGAVTMTYQPSGGGGSVFAGTVTYTPAVRVSTQSHTLGVPVTLGTRGLVYTQTLNPLPGVGSLTVDYRAMGRWYRLRDQGDGTLRGAADAEGTGSVSYTSGAALVTLGALPDVDSEVIFTWASSIHFVRRANATADNPTRGWQLRVPFANTPVKPGSVTIRWRAYGGDTEKTYTDPTGSGSLTPSNGGATPGTMDYVNGLAVLQFGQNENQGGVYPGTDTIVTIEYQQELPSGETPLVTSETIAVTTPAAFNCGRTNIVPKTFRMAFPLDVGLTSIYLVTVVDNGAGKLITLAGQAGSGWADTRWWAAGQEVGTVDYTSGNVTLGTVSTKSYSYNSAGFFWDNSEVQIAPRIGDYTVSSKAAASSYSAKTESIAVSDLGLTFDLTASASQAVVPGSLHLDFFADKYIDRNGKLYRALDAATGAASEAGTIDYSTGLARITAATYGNIGRNSGTPVKACVTAYGEHTITAAAFRTAGSPLRPGSLYVQASALDGELCTGTADVNGVITGAHVRGSVKAITGVASVEFGDIVSGEWIPREVFPSTLRYSCVVTSNLPLDPSILGLDPVRLPSDGRVPIVRPADTCVIHQTTHITLPNPVVAGATYASGRSPRTISNPPDADVIVPANTLLELRDATGQRIPEDRYTVDLGAGTVTMAATLDLTGYTQPLVLRERIEDMALITDAQITGDVSLAAPLLYAYTPGAYCSTALPAGDIVARVEKMFDQASWDGTWSDVLRGAESSGQFNDLLYPIAVSNQGAIKERWRLQVTNISPLTLAVYGENLGLIGTYPASATIAPVNPLTGIAYWSIAPGAWGAGGWSVGNNVRFNTVAANYPIWLSRTILGGAARTGDSFDIATRGDVD